MTQKKRLPRKHEMINLPQRHRGHGGKRERITLCSPCLRGNLRGKGSVKFLALT